ncbi:MAG: glycoside hydrolase family 13 protein, partial [Saprospiraceae bacterium]|nr:glycoside hydrolase family 13 protein [Saprospiraceae bacterium]
IRYPAGKEVKNARVEPLFWWVNMPDPNLEILIYDNNIKDCKVEIAHPGVQLINVDPEENPNYLFITIKISPDTKAGIFDIVLKKNNQIYKKYKYELKTRDKDENRIKGLNQSDVVYLIMPDRFANGNESNDSYDDLKQKGVYRNKMFFRHGGDLQGVMEHLDYLKDLGVTALWLNPILESDEYYETYHGYAMTDFYKIDKRFGTNEDYKMLVEKCHQKGIKVVMDIVLNHVGIEHWFVQDIPSMDWLNQQWKEFQRTNYRDQTLFDPYASAKDKEIMSDGWFDHHMPDLNQRNKHLAKYLIQNNIWWVEYTGLDAYRIDTYIYPDQRFMSDWGKAMKNTFPELTFFGETWVNTIPNQTYFTQNNHLNKEFNNNQPGVTDFQVYFALMEALQKPAGWTEGVARLYNTLANDYLYEDPSRNVTFVDNHDLARFYSMCNENIEKYKSGLSILFTLRGTPQLYYGTEILMKGFTDPDGKVRSDFPGGWKGDKENKFYSQGRTKEENIAYDHIKTLAYYRKTMPALNKGSFTQFIPRDGIYTYFRIYENQVVMVIFNSNDKKMNVETNYYSEKMLGFHSAKSLLTNKIFDNISSFELQSHETLILELK